MKRLLVISVFAALFASGCAHARRIKCPTIPRPRPRIHDLTHPDGETYDSSYDDGASE